tara:strand:+ start:512 stop:1507 length:996 start_codon:yes stop_codon:yes gene_type:complete
MNSKGTPPLFWPFAISILVHMATLPFAILDNNLPDKKRNEKIITITLEPVEHRTDSSPQTLEPIRQARLPEQLVYNETIPSDIVLPKIVKLPKLSNIATQKPLTSDIKPIAEILPQHLKIPKKPENSTDLSTPDPLHKPSYKQSLEPISRFDEELTQLTPPPPQPSKTALPEVIKNQRRVEEIEQIQTPPIVQSIPPALNKPLPQELTSFEEVVEEETELNISTNLNSSVVQAYATLLHNTLNKRVKRKYPRKAVQNCIEGTVKVQIEISPTGEQLGFEILNASAAPSILKKATEKLLGGYKGFSSFDENLSDQPMTFEVNLVYRLPQCAN